MVQLRARMSHLYGDQSFWIANKDLVLLAGELGYCVWTVNGEIKIIWKVGDGVTTWENLPSYGNGGGGDYYIKPEQGIPYSDLTPSVQASLDKADNSASASDLNGKLDIGTSGDASNVKSYYGLKAWANATFLTSHQDISGKLDKIIPSSDGSYVYIVTKSGTTITQTNLKVGASANNIVQRATDGQIALPNQSSYTPGSDQAVSKRWVNAQGFLTSHQDISGKLDKVTGSSTFDKIYVKTAAGVQSTIDAALVRATERGSLINLTSGTETFDNVTYSALNSVTGAYGVALGWGNTNADENTYMFGYLNEKAAGGGCNLIVGSKLILGASIGDGAIFGYNTTVADHVYGYVIGGSYHTVGHHLDYFAIFGDHNTFGNYIYKSFVAGTYNSVGGGTGTTSANSRKLIFMLGEYNTNVHNNVSKNAAYLFGSHLESFEDEQVIVGSYNAFTTPGAYFIVGSGSEGGRRTSFAVCNNATQGNHIYIGSTILTETQLQALLALI